MDLLIIFFILIAIAIVSFVIFALLKPNNNISPEDKPEYFQDKAKPGQNILQGALNRKQLKRDTKTQEVANLASQTATEGIRKTTEAKVAIFEKEALPERHEQTLAKEKAEHETYITQHKVMQTLANNALKDGLSVESQQQYLLQKFLSGLKVDEHKQLTDIDLENRWKEITQDLNAADLLVIAARGVINKLESDLEEARIKRFGLQKDKNIPNPLKKQLLADKDRSIEHLEAQIRGWQERETRLDLPQNQAIAGERNQARSLTEGETEG